MKHNIERNNTENAEDYNLTKIQVPEHHSYYLRLNQRQIFSQFCKDELKRREASCNSTVQISRLPSSRMSSASGR